MVPKDIEKWDKSSWDRNVYYCLPSGGGAVGVVFVWLGRKDFTNPATSDFVIKPIQGTAAPTKFAERILKSVAHASSPNSKAITKTTPGGIALLQTLKTYRDRESNPKTKARWGEIWNHYYNSQTFLIQELQTGMSELSEVYRKDEGLSDFLSNAMLMRNLGRLFAADALIGNGDRLFLMNTGNILFKRDGTFCAIDSATILNGYNDVLRHNNEEFQKAVKGLEQSEAYAGASDHYVKSYVHRPGQMLPSPFQEKQIAIHKPVVLPPSFGIREIFDIPSWWNGIFKPYFLRSRIVVSESTWASAFEQFKIGFDEGVRDIDRQLSGLNWIRLKAKYKEYAKKYGLDPNLNWDSFKLRRRYFKLLKKGASAEEALAGVQEYAKKNMPGL